MPVQGGGVSSVASSPQLADPPAPSTPVRHTLSAQQPLASPPKPSPEPQGIQSASIRTMPGTISIKSVIQQTRTKSMPSDMQPRQPLTSETVGVYWSRLLTAMHDGLPPNILQWLSEARVEIEDDMLTLHTEQAYLEQEMRPYKVRVLEWMRHESGHQDLNCRVEFHVPEVVPVIYDAQEKYEAMLLSNPVLGELRKLLPNIDL